MNSAKLSVLLPVYNAETYVARAVESILQQTYGDFEFIIIDDGSSDSSLEILQGFAQADKRIKLVSRENQGLVETLNEGLGLIHTPYIARMDADDIAMPTRFEKQMRYLDEHQDCLLLGTRVIIIDSDGDEICEMGDYFTHEDIDQGLMSRKGQLIYHPSVIMRMSAVNQLGGYRQNYPQVEDLDLFLRISELGKIENLPEPLLKYREHSAKVGFVHQEKQNRQITELLKEAHDRRGLVFKDTSVSPAKQTSLSDSWKNWAWWALGAGNVKTARKYAKKVWLKAPFNPDNWRLIYCTLRGY